MVSVNLKWSRTTSLCSKWRLELAATAAVMVQCEASLASYSFTMSFLPSGEETLARMDRNTVSEIKLCIAALWANSSIAMDEAVDILYELGKVKFLKEVSKCGGHIWSSASGVKQIWKQSSLSITPVGSKNLKIDSCTVLSQKGDSLTRSVLETPCAMPD